MYKHQDFVDSHIQFLGDIRKILFELDIKSGKVFFMKYKKDTEEFGLGIYRRLSLLKFASTVGFTHKIKSSRLVDYVKKHSNESLISNKSLYKV